MKQSNLLFMSAAMMLASCGGTKDAGQNGTLMREFYFTGIFSMRFW